MIATQSHDKFKVFFTPLDTNGLITPALEEAVRKFASEHAVKSVGVEFCRSKLSRNSINEQLVLSLGYRDDQPGYPVRLHSVSLGKPETETEIEKAMSEAASKVEGDVICHEFYVTDTSEYVMVLLTHG